jgi:hypothetical protein
MVNRGRSHCLWSIPIEKFPWEGLVGRAPRGTGEREGGSEGASLDPARRGGEARQACRAGPWRNGVTRTIGRSVGRYGGRGRCRRPRQAACKARTPHHTRCSLRLWVAGLVVPALPAWVARTPSRDAHRGRQVREENPCGVTCKRASADGRPAVVGALGVGQSVVGGVSSGGVGEGASGRGR